MTLHFCTPQRARLNAPEGGNRPGGAPAGRHFTVDFHCHVLTLAAEPLVADRPQKHTEARQMQAEVGAASMAHNSSVMLPAAFPKLTRLDERLADMDAMSVDMQVLSPSPSQYYYWADEDLARSVVKVQNEYIAGLCAEHPDRLVGLGTIALQHPQLAAAQLREAIKNLGLKGVQISTRVNEWELAAPELAPFWAAAQELGAVVFIHPFGTTLGERLSAHYLSNIIGQPLETTIALSHLIFGGVLDRHPGLKIVAAHGGGYLPSYCGRTDHGHAVRPEARAGALSKPSDYLRRIWFDTLVYEPQALHHLIESVGASQLVVGSDYPFDMGHYRPRALLAATPGLGDEERAAILGGNARALLGLGTVMEKGA